MKFNYYIIDTFNNDVKGTNSKSVAEDFAQVEEYFVVQTETGRWILPGNDSVEVKAIPAVQL